MGKKYTTDTFKKKLYDVNQDITVLGEYIKSDVGILCQCNTCLYKWSPTPNKLLQGRACPICANAKRGIHKDPLDFLNELALKNPLVILVGEYKNGHTKTEFQCKTCGNIWKAAPYSILAGHGCPKCYRTSTSFAEQFIFASLQQALPETEIINRNRSAIGKELDIYIPKYTFAIEFNGWVWHKNKISKDKEKVLLCQKRGITPLFIYDSCPENTLPIDCDYLLYNYDLGLETDYKTLKKIVHYIITRPEFREKSLDIDSIDWRMVTDYAFFNSRMKTTEQFKNELEQLTDNIKVIGEYKKSSLPIRCECLICGYKWNPTPNSLLRGNGCPNCSHKNGWDIHDLSSVIESNNPSFKNKECLIIGKTIIDGKIEVKCNRCGRIWMARYSDLLRGHGCGCNSAGKNRVIRGVNDILTKAPFLEHEWNYEKNDGVFPYEVAARSSARMWWKCSVCGYEWKAIVASRTAGHNCPECYKKSVMNKKAFKPKESLAEKAPQLLEEWSDNNTLDPLDVSPYSKEKVLWRCKKGHEWLASISNRYYGSGCPYCKRKKVLVGFNDLKTTDLELAEEWDYEKNGDSLPEQYLSGSNKKVWWKCKKCGCIWQAKINDRKNKHGCPICANEKRKKHLIEEE